MNLVKNKRNNRANGGRSFNARMGKDFIKPYFSNETLPNFNTDALQQKQPVDKMLSHRGPINV